MLNLLGHDDDCFLARSREITVLDLKWSNIVNPYDITYQTSVAEIPGIHDTDWYETPAMSEMISIEVEKKQPLGLTTTYLLYCGALLELRRYYSFAIPTHEAIETIKKYSPICEMGAGSGYWAKLLTEAGADVIAYDTVVPFEIKSYAEREDLMEQGVECNRWIRRLHFPVQHCDEEFIPPANRTLFICWPPYDEPMANDILNRYQGDTLVYIGEGPGEACADDNFFETLEEHWEIIDNAQIPRFYGIRDYLDIYQRKK